MKKPYPDAMTVRPLSLGLDEALRLTLDNITPVDHLEFVDLLDGVDRICAMQMCANVDSPSVDASLKDGYAVRSTDVAGATGEKPVLLRLTGSVAAGEKTDVQVAPGTAVRVLTGAKIPPGAEAVLAEEFVDCEKETILARAGAEVGRNILRRGVDVAAGEVLIHRGERLSPGLVGLLAAAGHSRLPVHPRVSVALLATGDEIVAPGSPLTEGKLYASNITTLAAWCRRYGINSSQQIVPDNYDAISRAIRTLSSTNDVLITSGGAWTGDRDLVAKILDELGWQRIYHRIRIGPGKAVGFGLLEDKPIFLLPGGPPSNLMGFLQLALPGLLQLAGHLETGLPKIRVRLGSDLTGKDSDWTQFIFGILEQHDDFPLFHQYKGNSRLGSMAAATAVVSIPEGQTHLHRGELILAQSLL